MENLTFDDAMKQLEDILNNLESNSESMSSEEVENKIFEAEKLRDHCRELLKKEKEDIIKTAKENNIPLSDLGISEEEDEYDDVEDEEDEEDK